MNYLSQRLVRLLIVFILTGFISTCLAANHPPYIKSLNGYYGQMKKDSFVLVSDNDFYSAALASALNKPYYERNIITLKINEDSMFYLPSSFTATVVVKIGYIKYRTLTDSLVDTTSLIKTFVINFDSTRTYTNRHSFVFDSAQRVLATIVSVTITGTNSTGLVLKSLVLENQIQPYSDYKFSCTGNAVTSVILTNKLSTLGEIKVDWPNITGADQYEVEWTYMDQGALSGYGNAANPDSPFVANIFANNSTRITTTNSGYNIPMIFPDTGTLYVRVRSVQIKPDGSLLASNWSSKTLPGGLGSFYFAGGHQSNLNWQSSVTFAEEGKRKVVVQYYDGTLRSRQTVTKDNTLGTTVTAETFYDYQGRPAIQVLPAPNISTIVQFTQLFNVTNTGEYDKSHYDKLSNATDYCDKAADSMSNTNGAASYYSTHNQYLFDIQRYIPDAQGYPFTETRYTQDNTGRIAKQSGVGPTFTLGSGHETKYYYATPDQDELDALFGTEVGDKSHYFKNAVKDANGQLSISYVDMHGRTIATALAGDTTSGMNALSSYHSADSITETLSDANNTVVKDLVMESHKSLLVTTTGYYTFNYDLNPQSFTKKDCIDTNVCYNCLYDLTITITDDCNNQHLPGGKPYVVTVQKGSLAAVNDTCNKASAGMHVNFSIPFSFTGVYEITKSLSVSKYADDFYRTNVFATKNYCKTKDTFVQQARVLLNTQCTPTYSACRDSLGTFSYFYARYVSAAGITATTPADTAGLWKEVMQTYQDGLKACYEFGDTSLTIDDDVRREMLLDVTAPQGQYANPDSLQDVYSILRVVSGQTYRVYQTPNIQYKDEFGNADLVMDDNNGQMVTPDKLDYIQFSRKFKDSWAQSLLQYHPEYCKLQQLDGYNTTLTWNKDFEKTDDYNTANSKGYLTPLAAGTYKDPISGTASTALQTQYDSYQSGSHPLSMLQTAVLTIYCNATNQNCIDSFYNYPKTFSNLNCTPEKDMAWRNFREIYIAAKKRIIDSLINIAGCTPTAQTLMNAHRFPHFNTPADAVNQNGLGYFNGSNLSTTTLMDSAKRRLDSFYAQNCRSYAQLWLSQLKSCTAYPVDSIYNVIIPRLVEVCKKGSNIDHPFGSREICPDSALALGQFRTFDDVINNYNSTHSIWISQYCNADLITYPGQYSKQTIQVNEVTYSKPDTCTCNKVNKLYVEYTSYGSGYTSFSDYLLKRYNTSVNQSSLDSLMGLCNGTTTCKFVSTAITIPPILQSGSASSCATCNEVTNYYNSFTQTYSLTPTRTETDTASQRKNRLFTSYMNSRLGISKQAWEYLDFMDRCTASAPSKCVGCDSLQNLIDQYFNSLNSGAGSESDMLNYMVSALQSKGLTTTVNNLNQALSLCHESWNKNVAFGGPTVAPGAYYIFKDSTSNMDIGSNGNPFTIECWANFTNSTLEQPLLNNLNAKNTTYFGPNYACTDNKNGYYVYVAAENSKKYLYARISDTHSDTSSYYLVRSSDTIVPLKWYHIVLTRSGNSVLGFKMYLNGQLTGNVLVRGSGNLLNGNITPLTPLSNGKYIKGLFLLYNSYTGGGSNSTAYLKNLRLYGRALSQSEVSTNYSNCDGNPYDTTSLKLWAKLVEAGNRPKDYSLYNTQGYWLFHYWTQCDTFGVQASQDSIGRWRGQRGSVSLSSCIPSLTNVLCNYPDTILLCGNSTPYVSDFNQVTNCSDSAFLATSAGTERYKAYTDSLNNNFDSLYHAKCMQAYKYESFTVSHRVTEYHYTLYYYDQGGNLVKTVPPQGVVPNRTTSWLQQVKSARTAGTTVVPSYLLVTEYRYNSLNQVITQTSPDGGVSNFLYDRLGRLVLSQNARQVTTSDYSYTKYDGLGRITEVGKIRSTALMNRTISRTQSQLDTWFSNADTSRKEITQTHYDAGYYVSLAPYLTATNLRNRVSWTAVYNVKLDIDSLKHAAATFYSYDIHGNVDTLLQDLKSLNDSGNRFKKIVYQYDLISGKVNTVAYQPGRPDQFYHRYTYDAENRITDVETSKDQLYWEHDAFYKYYAHGPLARTLIGAQQVQGVDYAYTLQGWLKGVNSTSLLPTHDMGGDGIVASNSTPVAIDAFGYALEYYGTNDYIPISNKKIFADGYTTSGFKPLYNGNIAAISLNIQYPTSTGISVKAPFYTYSYDQLNRLVAMESDTGLNVSTNTWLRGARQDYKERISYDPNGNIIGYLRNGTTIGTSKAAMDSLNYFYYYYTSNGTRKTYRPTSIPGDAAKLTNQLAYIKDTVNAGNYTVDIDNQSANNYTYDAIGNLTKDTKEQIDSIYWNVYGKITQINKQGGIVITFTYDAAGNRISKTVGTKQTWYVRDASGNVLSVYVAGDTSNSGHLTQSEIDVYGSCRLGLTKSNLDVTQSVTMPGPGSKYFTNFIRGQKIFELSNHLGNVMVTVTDKKLGTRSTNDTTKISYYKPDIISVSDYYAFGQQMPARIYNAGTYRYGFNGKEKDSATYGEGNEYDYGMRIYNTRIGRFLSVDPMTKSYPSWSPYPFAMNSPVAGVDLDGLEFLAINSSMYRMSTEKKTLVSITSDFKIKSQVVDVAKVAVVYENIPAVMKDPVNRDFKFVHGGPVTAKGRDWDIDIEGPYQAPEGRYHFATPAFWGAADEKTTNPPRTPSSQGLFYFPTGSEGTDKEAMDRNANLDSRTAAGANAVTHIAGIAKNFNNIDIWEALGNESVNRSKFYDATNLVNNYAIGDETLKTVPGRSALINFVTDGSLSTDGKNLTKVSFNELESSLRTVYTGYQIMLQKDVPVQDGLSQKVYNLIQEYKSRGGKLNFDKIYEFKRPQ